MKNIAWRTVFRIITGLLALVYTVLAVAGIIARVSPDTFMKLPFSSRPGNPSHLIVNMLLGDENAILFWIFLVLAVLLWFMAVYVFRNVKK